MTIKELVEKGLVKEVKVQRPPGAVIAATEKKSATIRRELNLELNCADISVCALEAMRESGETDWHIVPGFAFNPGCKDPHRHVWVRKGLLHYDPTWSRPRFCWNIEELMYYKVVKSLKSSQKEIETDSQPRIIGWSNSILRELMDLAAEWKLQLAGN
jgi:hypothetical protein